MTEEKATPLIPESLHNSLDQRPESPKRPTKIPRIACEDTIHGDDDGGEEEVEKQKDSISAKTMSQNPRLQRYLVAIEYIGTRFAGAQQQPNCRTVGGVLEEAFRKFIGQPVSIFCSSRTDAGVHALSNVCHVDVERISKRRPGEVLQPHEPAVVRRAVNHFLQKNEGDIMVIDVQCVPPDFHARYKAQERTYFYRLLSGPDPLSTFEKDRAWHVLDDLDIKAMQRACNVLAGHHDFSSFRAASCQAKSPIRTLDELTVTEVVPTPNFPSIREREQSSYIKENLCECPSLSKADLAHGSLVSNQDQVKCSNSGTDPLFGQRRQHRCYVVTARARSFLYHQVGEMVLSKAPCRNWVLTMLLGWMCCYAVYRVRLLVGALKSVGTGEITISDVERILNAKSVTAACPMAPACGLYLGNVKYDLPEVKSRETL